MYTYLVLFLTAKIIGMETHGCIKYFEANVFGRIDIELKSEIYGVESKLIVSRTCIKVVCRLKLKPFSYEFCGDVRTELPSIRHPTVKFDLFLVSP